MSGAKECKSCRSRKKCRIACFAVRQTCRLVQSCRIRKQEVQQHRGVKPPRSLLPASIASAPRRVRGSLQQRNRPQLWGGRCANSRIFSHVIFPFRFSFFHGTLCLRAQKCVSVLFSLFYETLCLRAQVSEKIVKSFGEFDELVVNLAVFVAKFG